MYVILLCVLLIGSAYTLKANFNHGLKGITTTKPLVIAHRGASGVYPEQTIPAYQVRQITTVKDMYPFCEASKIYGLNFNLLGGCFHLFANESHNFSISHYRSIQVLAEIRGHKKVLLRNRKMHSAPSAHPSWFLVVGCGGRGYPNPNLPGRMGGKSTPT